MSDRLYGFIRLWSTGPTEEEQRAALRERKVAADCIFVENEALKRRKRLATRDDKMTARHEMILRLKEGDEVNVFCAAALGNSLADVSRVLGWIDERGAVVRDMQQGQVVKGIAGSLFFADRAIKQINDMKTAAARSKLKESGIKTGPERKTLALPHSKLLAMWLRPDKFSAEDVAEAAGVSRGIIYKHFRGISRNAEALPPDTEKAP